MFDNPISIIGVWLDIWREKYGDSGFSLSGWLEFGGIIVVNLFLLWSIFGGKSEKAAPIHPF